jgi:hypothetical protein
LCLTIVGTPEQGPLHEGMRLAATCHTDMDVWLAMLWTIVSLTAQSMLGHSPTVAFQMDVVVEMLAEF